MLKENLKISGKEIFIAKGVIIKEMILNIGVITRAWVVEGGVKNLNGSLGLLMKILMITVLQEEVITEEGHKCKIVNFVVLKDSVNYERFDNEKHCKCKGTKQQSKY